MIQDRRQIQIRSSPDIVFDLIDKMPNKFPVYKLLETKPFFFLRVLLVDGLRTAIDAASTERPDDMLVLKVGDSLGPFRLTESEKPLKYWFSLNSFFFNCQTGYSLSTCGRLTTLSFDLFAENPNYMEKVWWFFFKPFHRMFANKTLRVIKERVEKKATQISDLNQEIDSYPQNS